MWSARWCSASCSRCWSVVDSGHSGRNGLRFWAGALATVSTVGFAVAVAIIVWLDFGKLFDAWAAFVPIVALATALAALGAGWVAGGPQRASPATGAVILAMRANAPALAVTGAAYGATSDAAAAIVVFALVSYFVAPVFGIWSRRVPLVARRST